MHKQRSYKMNCSDYVLHEGDQPVGPLMPAVAVAVSFDPEDKMWTLYKHGSPEGVHAWVNKQKKAQIDPESLAGGLHVLEGQLPVGDLNRCLENNAHIGALVQNCLAIGNEEKIEAKTLKIDGIAFSEAPQAAFALMNQMMGSKKMNQVTTTDNDIIDVVAKPARLAP